MRHPRPFGGILLATALLIAGCGMGPTAVGGGRRGLLGAPESSASAAASPTGTAMATPATVPTTVPTTPRPTASAPPPAAPTGGRAAAISGNPVEGPTLIFLHMADAMTGWATERSEGAVLRTTDGGRHWQRTMPPGLPFRSTVASYFLDASNAWVLSVPPGPLVDPVHPVAVLVTVYHTADGGHTWQHGAPFSSSANGRFAFSDPQHGWLLVGRGYAAGSEAVTIFRTTDGGLRWQPVATTPGTPGPDAARPPDGIPFGCHKDDLAFRDATTGWLAISCAGGAPFVLQTDDGGAVWRTVTLPAPPGRPALHGEFTTTAPLLFPPSGGVLLARILPDQALLYVTGNGGKTWAASPLPTAAPFGPPDFITPTTGWVTDGQRLYATRDGGRHWTTIAPNVSLYQTMLDFVSDQVGFAVSGNWSPYLFATTDGGHTWTRIPVRVTP